MLLLDRVFKKIFHLLNWIGIAAMLICILITSVDVVMRKAAHTSIPSVFEIVSYSMAFIVFLPLACAQMRNSHIRIDMFVLKFPKPVKSLCECVSLLVGLILWGCMGYGLLKWSMESWMIREIIPGSLSLPLYSFKFAAAVGVCALAIIFFEQLLIKLYHIAKKIPEEATRNEENC